ncbi:hypothetical protein H1684_003301 [Escherichia coli]|nr:hypothetical protein [Escherichia coli]QWV71976.1 hypothetical protein KQ220_05360 [Escherichia coli O158:H23]EER0128110.1 hypothetical protein [Escherichia coli]EER9792662.1 hypothetical protein [Escherichia coli]EES0860461.1 hypothetical protein [Escherichia coli]
MLLYLCVLACALYLISRDCKVIMVECG